MFRELYKEANDNIKGDRAILDKAFLKAAQPEKTKSPLLKYSFVGTCAAAVLVLGAVFLNADIFMEKTQNMPMPDEIQQTIVTPTEKNADATATFSDNTAGEAAITADVAKEEVVSGKRAETTPVTDAGTNVQEQGNTTTPEITNEPVVAMSVEEDLVAVAEIEDAASFTLKKPTVVEAFDETNSLSEVEEDAEFEEDEDDSFPVPEEATETVKINKHAGGGGSVASGSTGSQAVENNLTAKVFSYMQDITVYGDMEPCEYNNTQSFPIESVEEAIDRAKNECTVEYDIADAYFDPIERIWKIAFYFAPSDDMVMAGGGQNVYMTEDGITILVVYGE
ncbi:MAG: hypothetical protein IJ316_00990 [Clostridia bacterium]|nr:hypothetical protein [Clostridia bacterium]